MLELGDMGGILGNLWPVFVTRVMVATFFPRVNTEQSSLACAEDKFGEHRADNATRIRFQHACGNGISMGIKPVMFFFPSSEWS